jgi:hypothetical protein
MLSEGAGGGAGTQDVEDGPLPSDRPHSAGPAARRAGASAAGAQVKDLLARQQILEREIEVLRSQNAALRRNAAEEDAQVAPETPAAPYPQTENNSKEELRQQLHAKWESEKKLQKRYFC